AFSLFVGHWRGAQWRLHGQSVDPDSFSKRPQRLRGEKYAQLIEEVEKLLRRVELKAPKDV
ncbi:MAG: hypothetical protein ABWJ97_03040, partial [Thermoproteus sp.]